MNKESIEVTLDELWSIRKGQAIQTSKHRFFICVRILETSRAGATARTIEFLESGSNIWRAELLRDQENDDLCMAEPCNVSFGWTEHRGILKVRGRERIATIRKVSCGKSGE